MLPPVLVVEDRADVAFGHWPVLFAQVAGGFAAAGCRVEVLTSRGWCLQDSSAVPFAIHRYGGVATTFDRIADRLRRNRRSDRWRAWLRRGGEALRVAVVIRAAAARARMMGGNTVVVVVSNFDAPTLVGALAGRGRWLSYVYFDPHRPTTTIGNFADRVVRTIAAAAEHRRRRRGGRFVVGAPSPSLRDKWQRALPDADVSIVIVGGSEPARATHDAREQLGLDPSLRLALLFGSNYEEKDLGTVVDAFSDLDDWHLVMAGSLADDVPPSVRVLQRYPGYVDGRTRDLLYSCADLVVISYFPGFMRDSGGVRDAITWGVPVVCSDGCAPADVVREYRLGSIFEAGNAAELADAVRAVPTVIDRADLDRARAELSDRAAAERALHALGVL